MTILTFDGYDFGDLIEDFSTNFGDGAEETRRIPGTEGGWSDLGTDEAPTPPGRVSFSFWLTAESRSAMDAQRDVVAGLATRGLRRLIYISPDVTLGTRYCLARVVQGARPPEQKNRHTDLHQRVSIVFSVPDARWFRDRYTSWRLSDGVAADDGREVGEGALVTACSGLETEFSVTCNGNAMTIPAISILPDTSDTCENPRVQRIVNGVEADEIYYTGVLTDTDELFVDGKRFYAAVNADSVFGANFRYRDKALFRLAPGANTIRVQFANAGDTANVRLWFQDVYR